MKGVSPLIAAILLIAFTVAVGGIISTWITTLTTTTTGITQAAGEKQVKCATAVFDIVEVVSSLGVTDSINTTIKYIYGEQDLYFFNLTFIDDIKSSVTVTPRIGINYNKTNPLKPGMLAVFALNLSTTDVIVAAGLPGNALGRVSVLAKCQDTIPITDDCKSGEPCMK